MPFKSQHLFAKFVALLWLALALAACGVAQDTSEGGVGEDGSGVAPPATVIGVLKGVSDTALIVNGVTFDQTRAAVVDGFGNPLPREQIKLGMWVQVEGTVDDARSTGQATRIQVRTAVRGVVTALEEGGLSVTVLGSSATYNAVSTVFEGIDAPNELRVGDLIEAHGPLGSSAGQINASRIELIAKGTAPQFELRGKVSALNAAARTMTVGKQPVRYDGALLSLTRALENGQVIRVSATTAPTNGQPWALQRVVADQALPAKLAFFYAEGVTTEWAAGPQFKLEEVLVNAAQANGRAQVTGNGLSVATFGVLQDSVLEAKSVAIITLGQPLIFRLSATVQKFVSVSNFQVRGVAVDASGAQFINGEASMLANDKRVFVQGPLRGRTLVATRVEFLP